jgi:hypothetical protein
MLSRKRFRFAIVGVAMVWLLVSAGSASALLLGDTTAPSGATSSRPYGVGRPPG